MRSTAVERAPIVAPPPGVVSSKFSVRTPDGGGARIVTGNVLVVSPGPKVSVPGGLMAT